ncbi:MAG: hypothetical protein K5855_06775 [Oscillospiraceae bacterium]|nr:hypothetical protein [Oscillospiraceae bacterium]
MGLLSKILGGSGSDIKLDKIVKTVVDTVAEAAKNGAAAQPGTVGSPERSAPAPVRREAEREASGPSGFSWGLVMPDEENQFNFNGSHIEYFKSVFGEAFPEYDIRTEQAKYSKATVFTFRKGGQTALVVELLNSSSEARKLRRTCAEQGIPYLRYYYDHEGWWNTKAYVIERTRKALKF